jgi:hypothetical protein
LAFNNGDIAFLSDRAPGASHAADNAATVFQGTVDEIALDWE